MKPRSAGHLYVGPLMPRSAWLLVATPTVFSVVAFAIGAISIGTVAAFAILQVMFLAAAFERIRFAARKQRGEPTAMPMWQKILLGLIIAYGVLLVFVGALTKQ